MLADPGKPRIPSMPEIHRAGPGSRRMSVEGRRFNGRNPLLRGVRAIFTGTEARRELFAGHQATFDAEIQDRLQS